jgi:hypothetical protein
MSEARTGFLSLPAVQAGNPSAPALSSPHTAFQGPCRSHPAPPASLFGASSFGLAGGAGVVKRSCWARAFAGAR